MDADGPYVGTKVALLTQHGKEQALGPVFSEMLSAALRVVDGFDTDTLGTFTREIARPGTQLDTARRKSQLAAELSGLSCGLGSEGAFVPGPLGVGTWNLELVVFTDAVRQIEVVGRARDVGHHRQAAVSSFAQLRDLAVRADFPHHGLVVRPGGPDDGPVVKGIRDWAALESAFHQARLASASGNVWVESDLRAHMNPSRMRTIAKAGRDLGGRLQTVCPACSAPGFGRGAMVPGRPCAACGLPTGEPIAERLACVACSYAQNRPLVGQPATAEPGNCAQCNP